MCGLRLLEESPIRSPYVAHFAAWFVGIAVLAVAAYCVTGIWLHGYLLCYRSLLTVITLFTYSLQSELIVTYIMAFLRETSDLTARDLTGRPRPHLRLQVREKGKVWKSFVHEGGHKNSKKCDRGTSKRGKGKSLEKMTKKPEARECKRRKEKACACCSCRKEHRQARPCLANEAHAQAFLHIGETRVNAEATERPTCPVPERRDKRENEKGNDEKRSTMDL